MQIKLEIIVAQRHKSETKSNMACSYLNTEATINIQRVEWLSQGWVGEDWKDRHWSSIKTFS